MTVLVKISELRNDLKGLMESKKGKNALGLSNITMSELCKCLKNQPLTKGKARDRETD